MKLTRLATAASFVGLSACSCITFGTRDDDAASTVAAKAQEERATDEAKVQQVWQEVMMNRLEAEQDGASEAFGLFSEGGWADAGQVMIFVNQTRTAAWSVTVKPGQKNEEPKTPLPESELSQLWDMVAKAEGLNDIKVTSFDGLVFEYVHAKRNARGNPEVVKRLYMKTAGDPAPNHDLVVSYFQGYLK